MDCSKDAPRRERIFFEKLGSRSSLKGTQNVETPRRFFSLIIILKNSTFSPLATVEIQFDYFSWSPYNVLAKRKTSIKKKVHLGNKKNRKCCVCRPASSPSNHERSPKNNFGTYFEFSRRDEQDEKRIDPKRPAPAACRPKTLRFRDADRKKQSSIRKRADLPLQTFIYQWIFIQMR